MYKKFRECLQAVYIMAKSNFDSWMHSPRTWILLLFVIAFCYVVAGNFTESIQGFSYGFNFFELLFYLLYNGCSITTTSILFLITISELPRRIGYQNNMLIRSTRAKWLQAQIVYCIWMALCMLTLTAICTSIFIVPHALPGNDWSETVQIASGAIQERKALIPSFIRNAFQPWSACLFAMIPMFLFWLTMIFVVLFFSLCKVPLVGLLTYAFILVANVVLLVEVFDDFPMPIYYATLRNITGGLAGGEIEKVLEVFVGYGLVVLGLLAGMFISVRKTDLVFSTEE